MNTITLSDYLGYIFSEIVEARAIADNHSKEIAEKYSKDEVLKSFSVPRFKIPEMNLNIPVLVTGAKLENTFRFKMTEDAFKNMITAQLNYIVNSLRKKKSDFTKILDIKPIPIKIRPGVVVPVSPRKAKANSKIQKSASIISSFYNQLKASSDEQTIVQICEIRFAELLKKTLVNEKLEPIYKAKYPNSELYFSSVIKIIEIVENNYVIEKVKVDNLLVSPLTNIVKSEGDENSIFTINAKIVEDGVFIKTVQDEQGNEKKVVDFE